MKLFAKLDTGGFVVSTVYSSIQQPEMVEINELPQKPDGDYKFHLSTGTWQKTNDILFETNYVNEKRKNLLQQSDWTQLPDVPLETKQAWATYRQALRDITAQEGYPFDVIWPVPPQ